MFTPYRHIDYEHITAAATTLGSGLHASFSRSDSQVPNEKSLSIHGWPSRSNQRRSLFLLQVSCMRDRYSHGGWVRASPPVDACARVPPAFAGRPYLPPCISYVISTSKTVIGLSPTFRQQSKRQAKKSRGARVTWHRSWVAEESQTRSLEKAPTSAYGNKRMVKPRRKVPLMNNNLVDRETMQRLLQHTATRAHCRGPTATLGRARS